MTTEYNLFVSDYHVPFHLRSGHKIFLDVCKYLKPTKVTLGGDIIDFFGISRFLRSHRSTVSLKDEINTTKKILTDIRNANKNSEITYIQGNHECFDMATEVLTKEGWKNFEDTPEESEIGTYNTKTQAIEYQKPIKLHLYPYDGEMFAIKDEQSTDLLITPNHRLLFRPANGGYIFNQVENMKNHRVYFPSSSECKNTNDYNIKDDEIEILAKRGEEIPDWVDKLSQRQFEIFLNVLLTGNASRYRGLTLYLHKTKNYLDQLQQICLHFGYTAIISEYLPTYFRMSIYKRLESCIDNLQDKIEKIKYKGNVWCVTTPNDTVIVRRNGKVSITGNCRLFKYIALHSMELGSLDELTVKNLLGLDKLGIKFHENPEPKEGYSDFVDTYYELCSGDNALTPKLIVGHFNKCCGNGGTAKRLIEEKGDVSIIQGHTHRIEVYTKKTITGRVLIGVEAGGMFDSEQNSYVRSPNWQNGFVLVETHNTDYNITPLVIANNKLVLHNKLFRG